MPYCPSCGSAGPEESKFCPTCGTAFAQTPPPEGIPTLPQIGQQAPLRPKSPNAGCGKAGGIGCGVVVILFVVFVALGAMFNTIGNSGRQFSSQVRSSQPHHAASLASEPHVLLDVEGNGIKTTQRFEAPDEWALVWTYDCSNFENNGNFIINVQGDVDDLAANQLGSRGRDITYEHSGGNVYLSINS